MDTWFFICLDLACVCVLGAGEALEVLEGVDATSCRGRGAIAGWSPFEEESQK